MIGSITLAGFLVSCTTFKHSWNEPHMMIVGDPLQYIEKAQQMESVAASADEVKSLIEAYKDVERADPKNYTALWKIGNYHILLGAAYSTERKEKKYHYREAVKYCEKAMYTKSKFRDEISNGADITEASTKLTIAEIDAMGYWYTARFYYFSECLHPLGRVINTKIVIENNKIIEQIDSLNPNWAGGGNYFARGLYYIAVPERFGGSKQRSEEEFSKAVEIGPDFLVNRWGRAKYLYKLTGNDEGYYNDLQWVISQDPHKGGNPYPWNIYFQKNAEEMLAESK
jgi:hypothetical protein